MGLFSSKKKVYVSSSVYNLAGDPENRMNFKKTALMAGILNGEVSNTITDSYLGGPGIKHRSYSKWTRNKGYAAHMGIVNPSVFKTTLADTETLKEYLLDLPENENSDILIQEVEVGDNILGWFITQEVISNFPQHQMKEFELLDQESGDSNNLYRVKIKPDNIVVTVTLPPVTEGRYLYVSYYTLPREGADDVEDDPVWLPGFALPPESYVLEKDTGNISKLHTIFDHTKITFIDLDNNEEVISDTKVPVSDVTYPYRQRIYNDPFSKVTSEPDPVTNEPLFKIDKFEILVDVDTDRDDYTLDIEDVFEDGEKIGEKHTETWKDKFTPSTNHRYFVYEEKGNVPRNLKILTYLSGSGSLVLDALMTSGSISTTLTGFVPPIPISIEKVFLDPDENSNQEIVGKAYRKQTKRRFKEIVDKLKENDDLDNINYIYNLPSVTLNSKNKECRRYIFEFFNILLANTWDAGQGLLDFQYEWGLAEQSVEDYNSWLRSYYNNPIAAGLPPKIRPFPTLKKTQFEYKTTNSNYPFKIQIEYVDIRKTTGTGLKEPGRKARDVWITIGTPLVQTMYTPLDSALGVQDGPPIYIFDSSLTNRIPRVEIHYQSSLTSWETITITGLTHNNYIYKNKGVVITGEEAILDEDESGFLIPLSDTILKRIKLVNATQVALESNFLVLNSYKVVKKKWYQSGWFKIVVVIIAVVAAYFTGGTSTGVLGASVEVGAAMGFAAGTVAAAIAGSIANALAAMVITHIITAAADKLFGDKLGGIIGAIASFIAIGQMTSANSGTPFKLSFDEFTKSSNLIKMSVSTANTTMGYIDASTKEILLKSQEIIQRSQDQLEQIAKQSKELIGANNLDPFLLMAADLYRNETSDEFLSRTLMTGSDIAELTNNMITNFASINLDLKY